MDAAEELKRAFHGNDFVTVRRELAKPELRPLVNAPLGPFDTPAIVNARSREMVDVLLEAGADINAKSQWWAGGFCLLDFANDDLSRYAISRGATVEIHAAARLGMMERLKEIVAADPKAVSARGGDGKMALHFARNVEVAKFLLDHGAEIDARDIDHESTAAQHLIGDHPEVVRFLVERGCATDIFTAAALGDLALAKRHLQNNPDCVRWRVTPEFFPMRNPRAGGIIYIWTLGNGISPHVVAAHRGHREVLQLLMDHSSAEMNLVSACWAGDGDLVRKILAGNPGVVGKIAGEDQRALTEAAQKNDFRAVELMLEAGLPRGEKGQHGATPMHWAAWRGNPKLVELLLQNGLATQLEARDRDYNGTPLDWAIFGSENGWDIETGDYGGVVRALLAGGAKRPEKVAGSAAVREALGS